MENYDILNLKEKWTKEKEINPGLTLTAFVYKWSDFIATEKILKELYIHSGLEGKFRAWLYSYKKRYYLNIKKNKY